MHEHDRPANSTGKGEAVTRRIYITGCAHSGTTLVARLFHAFKDVDVLHDEMPLDRFVEANTIAPILVAKRTHNAVLSADLPLHKQTRQMKLAAAHDVEIVNVLRDGRAVISSRASGKRVPVSRWVACADQAATWGNVVKRTLRYERILREPQEAQVAFAHGMELEMASWWDEYPAFVPASANRPRFDGKPEYDLRPLDPTRADVPEKWDRRIDKAHPIYPRFCSALRRHGYN